MLMSDELSATPLALRDAALQQRGADAVAGALLLVEREQVVRHLARRWRAVGGGLRALAVQAARSPHRERPSPRRSVASSASSAARLVGQRRLALLDGLHHGELDVLEVALALGERGELLLEGRDVLDRRARLQPLAVAGDPRLDDRDIRLGALQLGLRVLPRAGLLGDGARSVSRSARESR